MPNFSGWRRWDKELGDLNDLQTKHNSSIVEAINTVLDQISTWVNVPPDSDLAELFKTATHNVIYRVIPNINIKNTCVPNTQYSFYVLEGTFIAGYSASGQKYLCNFVNKTFTYWFKVIQEIKFGEDIVPLNGWAFTDFRLVKIGNIVTFNFIAKDGIRNRNTAICKLPQGFGQIGGNVGFPVASNSSKNASRMVILTNGNMSVFDIEDSTGEIVCSGSFVIDK